MRHGPLVSDEAWPTSTIRLALDWFTLRLALDWVTLRLVLDWVTLRLVLDWFTLRHGLIPTSIMAISQ